MLLMADDVLWRNYRDRISENTFLREHVVVGRAQQDFYVEQKREGPATAEPGSVGPVRTRGPMTNAPVSLSVFFLITHHSSHDKAPHKLQSIVPGRSSCHRTAPRFRAELIVDTEQRRRTPGPTHIYGHPKPLLCVLTHIHRLI